MLNMHQDLVSIITPSYNSEEFISETIISIQNQTYTNWELLITDDFSSDNTIKTIESFNKNYDRIKLFRLNENQGAGFARNNSIKESKGKFIAFCDSDDQWKPNKLEKQIHFIKQNNLVFTYSSYDLIDESGNFIKSINSPITLSLKNILSNNNVTVIDKFLSKEEFISFINLSDVILLPYLKISQSGVLMSVLSEKKRVLVSNIGGLIEPLKNCDIGWVLEELNVEYFKNLILKITREIKKTDDISDFKKIKDLYSWDVISNKTYKLYLKLI